MTFTSKGNIEAPSGWRIEWDVVEGQGSGTSHSPGGRVHVVEGEITPQYLARRIAMFVEMHCRPRQAEMALVVEALSDG